MYPKRLFFLILTISILGVGASCHKTNTQVPTTKYRVTHIVDSANYYANSIYEGLVVSDYQITYADNRIASIISTVSNPSSVTNIPPSDSATFFFYFSTYAIHHSSFPFNTDSVFFNSFHEITSSNGGINIATFNYNTNFQLTFYQIDGFTTSTSGSNIWDANGNISSIIAADTAVVSYYTDRSGAVGDYNEIANFLTFGNTIFHTKNLTKSIISSSRNIAVTYALDNNGNITNTRSNAYTNNIYTGAPEQTIHSYTFEYGTY